MVALSYSFTVYFLIPESGHLNRTTRAHHITSVRTTQGHPLAGLILKGRRETAQAVLTLWAGTGLGGWISYLLCTWQGKTILDTKVRPLYHRSSAGAFAKWPAP